MLMGPHNFLTHVKNLVMGGGRDSAGNPRNDAGFLKRANIGLQNIAPTSDTTATAAALTGGGSGALGAANGAMEDMNNAVTATDGTTPGAAALKADVDTRLVAIGNNFEELYQQHNKLVADVAALRVKLGMAADETNARVIKVEEAIDTIGNIVFPIPRDYDEATDVLVLRVLASQLTLATDNDVQLDSELYKKRAGVALSADLAPAAPSTVLSTTEQWIEFSYTGNSFRRDDVAIIELLTDGHNDTDGEEVLIHAVELVYRSTLVSYDEKNSANADLR